MLCPPPHIWRTCGSLISRPTEFAQICISELKLQFHIHNWCNLKQGNSPQAVKLLSVSPLWLTPTLQAFMFLQVRMGDRNRHHHSRWDDARKCCHLMWDESIKTVHINEFTHLFVNKAKSSRLNHLWTLHVVLCSAAFSQVKLRMQMEFKHQLQKGEVSWCLGVFISWYL